MNSVDFFNDDKDVRDLARIDFTIIAPIAMKQLWKIRAKKLCVLTEI